MNKLIQCKNCDGLFLSDFSRQKFHYGKLMLAGFTDNEAKEILPVCSKCLKDFVNQKTAEKKRVS